MKLDGQVAVITGSGRGIGRAIALAYAREGAKLALAARNESELQEAVSAVSELGTEAIAVRTDVTSQKDTERLAHRVVERFGRINVLVNNAGNSGPIGPLQGNGIADWVNTINVNLTGTFLMCRAIIPMLAHHVVSVGQSAGSVTVKTSESAYMGRVKVSSIFWPLLRGPSPVPDELGRATVTSPPLPRNRAGKP